MLPAAFVQFFCGLLGYKYGRKYYGAGLNALTSEEIANGTYVRKAQRCHPHHQGAHALTNLVHMPKSAQTCEFCPLETELFRNMGLIGHYPDKACMVAQLRLMASWMACGLKCWHERICGVAVPVPYPRSTVLKRLRFLSTFFCICRVLPRRLLDCYSGNTSTAVDTTALRHRRQARRRDNEFPATDSVNIGNYSCLFSTLECNLQSPLVALECSGGCGCSLCVGYKYDFSSRDKTVQQRTCFAIATTTLRNTRG